MDPTLSQFEDELINSNSVSPSLTCGAGGRDSAEYLNSHRRDSSDWLSSHSGSIDSRGSSIDIPMFARRDSNSHDMLISTNGEDDNYCLGGDICLARHSLDRHHFLQDLLNLKSTP